METIKLLSEFSIVRFLELVNEVFSDYPVPVKWDILSFNLDARENSISLSDSFVFLKDDRPVGFIICCIRRNRGRIDAMGVVKSERGTGLAYKILEHALEALRWKRVESVVLEVLKSEAKAIRFYEKNGFRTTRELHSLIKEVSTFEEDEELVVVKTDARWVHQASVEASINLHRFPNWQREPTTLLLASGRYNYSRINLHRSQGYLVWGSNSENAFIVDCSPIKDLEVYPKLLEAASKYICKTENKRYCTIFNVPENDPLYSAAIQSGYNSFMTQLEMSLQLY